MTREEFGKLADSFIEDNREAMIKELMGFVSHPSVSRADLAAPGAPYGPDCRAMLDYALERGKKVLGILPDGTDDPLFRAEDYEGHCGALLYGDAEEEMGVVAHLDVVPEGNGWIYEPFSPVIKDGFMIGRGADDNKAAAVIGLYLMKFFREHRGELPLKHTLRLFMGCAEETGMADLAHYVEAGLGSIPGVSIVADASFPVCYAQKGGIDATLELPAGKNLKGFKAGLVRNAVPDEAVMLISGITEAEARTYLGDFPSVSLSTADDGTLKLTASGKAGHAAFPVPGEYSNAIVNAAAAAAVLEEKAGLDIGTGFIAEALASPFGEGLGIAREDAESGRLTFNIGVVRQQGDRISGEIDIRYPVTADSEEILAKLERAVKNAGGRITRSSVAKPYYISPEDPKVTALLTAYRAVTGDEAQPYSMGGGTYSRVFPKGVARVRDGKFVPGFVIDLFMGRGNRSMVDMIYPGITVETCRMACREVYSYRISDQLQNTSSAVEFWRGSREPYPAKGAKLLKKQLPSMTERVFPNMGHCQFLHEHPAEYAALLDQYI